MGELGVYTFHVEHVLHVLLNVRFFKFIHSFNVHRIPAMPQRETEILRFIRMPALNQHWRVRFEHRTGAAEAQTASCVHRPAGGCAGRAPTTRRETSVRRRPCNPWTGPVPWPLSRACALLRATATIRSLET